VVPGFPHLAPTEHEDIPALADLLGLREHVDVLLEAVRAATPKGKENSDG
jgi:hypothetical protein